LELIVSKAQSVEQFKKHARYYANPSPFEGWTAFDFLRLVRKPGWTDVDMGGMMVSYPPGYFDNLKKQHALEEAERKAFNARLHARANRMRIAFYISCLSPFVYALSPALFYLFFAGLVLHNVLEYFDVVENFHIPENFLDDLRHRFESDD
jgi:hypothetical protein